MGHQQLGEVRGLTVLTKDVPQGGAGPEAGVELSEAGTWPVGGSVDGHTRLHTCTCANTAHTGTHVAQRPPGLQAPLAVGGPWFSATPERGSLRHRQL